MTPFVGELVVSVWRPIFYDRTLIWTTLPLYVLLAAGIVQLGRRPLVVAALVLLVALDGLGLRSYFVDFKKEEWREAAAYVAAQVRDDDLILFNATWVQLPFDYYFEGYGRPVARHGAPVDLFERGVLEPKMAAADVPRLRSLVAGHRRVWLVYSHDWYTDPQGIVPRVLEETLDLRERRRFEGLELQRYESSE